MLALRGFLAGFASTLVFHQGALWLLGQLGVLSRPVWSMAPVPPFGVPAVISLAFFGGLWGALFLLMFARLRGGAYWLACIGLGALLPSLVALLVVFPLKGQAFAAGGDPKIWMIAFLLNGAWGLGLALLSKLRVDFRG